MFAFALLGFLLIIELHFGSTGLEKKTTLVKDFVSRKHVWSMYISFIEPVFYSLKSQINNSNFSKMLIGSFFI